MKVKKKKEKKRDRTSAKDAYLFAPILFLYGTAAHRSNSTKKIVDNGKYVSGKAQDPRKLLQLRIPWKN